MTSGEYPIRCQCSDDNGRAYRPQSCDLHAVPTVCVCAVPAPNRCGECQTCKRPYKPEVPGFDACRKAWRTQLEENACV
jgi:hypothetical protein